MANKHQLKAGPISAYAKGVPIAMGASEVITAWSGKIVKPDGSGRFEIADYNTTYIAGWAEIAAQTCSSTEGATKAQLIIDTTCLFRMPYLYDNSTYTVNYADSLISEVCDIKVVSNVQSVNPTLSTYDVVCIWGGLANSSTSLQDGWVDVSLSPLKMYTTGTID